MKTHKVLFLALLVSTLLAVSVEAGDRHRGNNGRSGRRPQARGRSLPGPVFAPAAVARSDRHHIFHRCACVRCLRRSINASLRRKLSIAAMGLRGSRAIEILERSRTTNVLVRSATQTVISIAPARPIVSLDRRTTEISERSRAPAAVVSVTIIAESIAPGLATMSSHDARLVGIVIGTVTATIGGTDIVAAG